MKVKAGLPKGDADGLSAIEPQAIKKQKPIVALVILEPAKLDEDLHTREKELIVSIRRIEALLPEDVEAATRLLQRAFESRTGEATLPIELENDVKDALKGVELYVPNTAPDDGPEVPEGGYEKMLVKDLRGLLKSRGLDHSQGTKTELVSRLTAADKDVSVPPTTGAPLFSGDTPPDAADIDDADWEAAAPVDEDAPDESPEPPEGDDDE